MPSQTPYSKPHARREQGEIQENDRRHGAETNQSQKGVGEDLLRGAHGPPQTKTQSRDSDSSHKTPGEILLPVLGVPAEEFLGVEETEIEPVGVYDAATDPFLDAVEGLGGSWEPVALGDDVVFQHEEVGGVGGVIAGAEGEGDAVDGVVYPGVVVVWVVCGCGEGEEEVDGDLGALVLAEAVD
ncbi:unnamed protein product [Aspergillus oryzae]|nr:unnamed protein product [Aspergillus oryzae]GMF88518.1 unnamed protein product [Aspergillus oryzae]